MQNSGCHGNQKEKLKKPSGQKLTVRFHNNLVQIVLGWPSTKGVQIMLIGWKTWPPGGMVSFFYVNLGNLARETTFANVVVLWQKWPRRGGHMFYFDLDKLWFYILLICQHNSCTLNETADLSKFIAELWEEMMLSYTFINCHFQVSDPGPKGPLVLKKVNRWLILFVKFLVIF